MVRYAVIFASIAIFAAFVGFGGVATPQGAGVAQVLFVGFLILAVLSLVFDRRMDC